MIYPQTKPYCKNCGADVDVSEEYFKYCPLCGAKMDLEE